MFDLLDFESVADPSAATAGAPAGDGPSQTAPAATPTEGAPGGETDTSAVATETAPAATPQIDFTDPAVAEVLDAMLEQRLAPIAHLVQQQYTPAADTAAPQPGALVPPDPFSDNYAQEMAAYQQARDEQMFGRFQEMLGQIAQPINAQIEAQTTAEGNQRLQDMIADDISRNGDFPRAPGETESKAQNLVKPLAEQLFPQIAARYGNSPKAAEIAIQQASQTVRSIIAEARAAALAENTNQLATLSGARTDLNAAGSGSGLTVLPDGPTTARDRVSRYARQIQGASS